MQQNPLHSQDLNYGIPPLFNEILDELLEGGDEEEEEEEINESSKEYDLSEEENKNNILPN